MAGQQAAQYELSGAQQLADMAAQQANLQSQGYATQAAAAGKMLELGSPEQMQQQRLLEVQGYIADILAGDPDFIKDGFQRLMSIYADDPAMQQYVRYQMQQSLGQYQ